MRKKLIAYLLVLRPQFWVFSLCPAMAGYIISLSINNSLFSLPLFLGLLFIFGPGIAGASEAFNDYFDREYDKAENVKKCGKIPFTGGSGLIQKGILKPAEVLFFSLFLFIVSLVISLKFNPLFVLLVCLGIFIAISYSMPPIRLKNRGMLAPIAVGLGYGTIPFFAAFLIVSSRIPFPYLICGLLLGVFSFGLQGITDLMDFCEDKENGIRTFPIQIGQHRASIVDSICQISPFFLIIIFNLVRDNSIYVNFLFWIIFPIAIFISFFTMKNYSNPNRLSRLYLFSFIASFAAFIFV